MCTTNTAPYQNVWFLVPVTPQRLWRFAIVLEGRFLRREKLASETFLPNEQAAAGGEESWGVTHASFLGCMCFIRRIQ
jgi:hypothetical protein